MNHKDGNKLNNHISNLEWVSYTENSNHSIENKLNDCCREVDQYSKDGIFIRRWKSIAEASRMLNLGKTAIINSCKGLVKNSSTGFIWKYSFDKEDKKIHKIILNDFIDIQGYTNYMISPRGEVYSKYSKTLMTPDISTTYKRVSLKKSGREKHFSIHTLVAKHFIPNPDNFPIVNHKDGNKHNNNVNNLEWTTVKENIQHAIDTGLFISGHTRAVLQYDLTGKFIKEYPSIAEASRASGCNRCTILRICQGNSKKPKKYLWKYKDKNISL